MIFTLDPIDGRHIEVNQSDLTHYRELNADEAEQWANGWATFPLAVETDHGVLVPNEAWHTHDVAPLPHGRDGADNVISDAWAVRFVRHVEGARWVVVDVEASVVTRDEGEDVPRDGNGAVLDEEGDPVQWVQTMLHYVVCTDPANPGESELWSDREYDDEDVYWLIAGADFDRECQGRLREWLRHGHHWITWDGRN
jgi:hypothetical protein